VPSGSEAENEPQGFGSGKSRAAKRARLHAVRIPSRPSSAASDSEQWWRHQGARTRGDTARTVSKANEQDCLRSVRIPSRPFSCRAVARPRTNRRDSNQGSRAQTSEHVFTRFGSCHARSCAATSGRARTPARERWF